MKIEEFVSRYFYKGEVTKKAVALGLLVLLLYMFTAFADVPAYSSPGLDFTIVLTMPTSQNNVAIGESLPLVVNITNTGTDPFLLISFSIFAITPKGAEFPLRRGRYLEYLGTPEEWVVPKIGSGESKDYGVNWGPSFYMELGLYDVRVEVEICEFWYENSILVRGAHVTGEYTQTDVFEVIPMGGSRYLKVHISSPQLGGTIFIFWLPTGGDQPYQEYVATHHTDQASIEINGSIFDVVGGISSLTIANLNTSIVREVPVEYKREKPGGEDVEEWERRFPYEFYTELPLIKGKNIIEIRVEDEAGHVGGGVFAVIREVGEMKVDLEEICKQIKILFDSRETIEPEKIRYMYRTGEIGDYRVYEFWFYYPKDEFLVYPVLKTLCYPWFHHEHDLEGIYVFVRKGENKPDIVAVTSHHKLKLNIIPPWPITLYVEPGKHGFRFEKSTFGPWQANGEGKIQVKCSDFKPLKNYMDFLTNYITGPTKDTRVDVFLDHQFGIYEMILDAVRDGENEISVKEIQRRWELPLFISPREVISFVTSPVNLIVRDSAGRITGLIDNSAREEIPNSKYLNGIIEIVDPEKDLTYEVVGLEGGTYGLVVMKINEEWLAFTSDDIPVSAKEVHIYSIDWNALEKGEKGVTVQIDFDGDGSIGHEFSCDATLTQDEFKENIKPFYATPMGIAAISGLAIVAVIVALVIRKKVF